MSDFINSIRMHSLIANSYQSITSVGIVTGYDPENYLVTVEIYPQNGDEPSLQTGWIPLFSPAIGSGWGFFLPPNIGDIIEVHYQEGSLQNAYAGMRSYTYEARPLAVQSGEFWLVHKSGSFLKFTNDGNVSISSGTQIDVTAPVVNIDSAQVNLGNGTLETLLNSTAATVYNGHSHPSNGAPPDMLMTASNETTNTKAS